MPAARAVAQGAPDAPSADGALAAQRAQPAPSLGRPAIAAAAGGEHDVARSVLVGPGGQVYEPAAPGTWQRRFGGGIAPVVLGATMAGQALFAHGETAPLFRLDGTAWQAHPLPNRGPCLLGRGAVAAAAVGRHVYTWRDSGWTRLGSVQGVVTALWAESATRAHAATAQGGLWRVTTQGTGATAVPTPQRADDPIVLLTGHTRAQLYGVTRSGAVLSIRERATLVGPEAGANAALAGWVAQVAAADVSGTLWALGWLPTSGQAVLARTQGNVLIAVETMTGLVPGDRFVALQVDHRGGMLWATESGTVRYRPALDPSAAAHPEPARTGWQDGQVLGELPSAPAAFPGRGPARAR